jgi:N-acetyl-1-D-myo-inositol-2-amino-2-deoxy-alpha-D-glucopyranoside deacetylase
MGLPTNNHPKAFWQADLDAAAELLLEVIREVRPQVVVTYDASGGYGHPDHIQTHRVAMRAVELADAEGIGPQKVFWSALPRSVIEAGIQEFANSTENPFGEARSVDELPFVVPDENIAAKIEAGSYGEQKMDAVRAHATQIPEKSWLSMIASTFGVQALGVEYYQLAPGGPNADEVVADLFDGVVVGPPVVAQP